MQRVECAVIGGGVVGLAVARALAQAGREVIVLEREYAIGMITSSRNSEVIHAGIYYPTGSLKARACVEGRDQLYKYCDVHGVPYKRTGKLIVATDESQLPQLNDIQAKARANGVMDLEILNVEQLRELEPEVSCVGGLLSPSTGVLDSHAFMLALQGDAEDSGAFIAFQTEVTGGKSTPEHVVLETSAGELGCDIVVNTAGLHAPGIASMFSTPSTSIPKGFFAKGNYYKLEGQRTPFNHLVYPVPEPNTAGLGVHATIDIGGSCRFGPDVEWVEGPDAYDVDPARADAFYAAVRRYWPGLQDGALVPDYAGIRPKISGPGDAAADFCLLGPRDHGTPGLYHMLGIESPGLTSSMALADRMVVLIDHGAL